MKRIRTYFFSVNIIAVMLALCPQVYGQSKHLQKTYHWKYAVDQNVNLTFNNYDCDLIIHTWDRKEIEFNMSIDANMRSGEEAGRLDAYLDDLEFKHSAGNVELDSRFWKNRRSRGGVTTIDLKDEKSVRCTKFNLKGELWIPIASNLNLESKYSGIELDDLNGNVSFVLYNDKLYGKNIQKSVEIEAKYSTLEFAEMKDIHADFYNTDFEAGNIGQLHISSKYSKFNAGDAGNLTIDAYNDKYAFGNTGDVRFVDKYSDLRVGRLGRVEMDVYNSTVTIEEAETIKLKSKYCKFEIDEANLINISDTYNDNYKIKALKTINIDESRYGTYKLEKLSSSLLLKEGYSDKLTVSSTGKEFNGINVNGKYVKAQVNVEDDLPFRFEANVKYPKFDIKEEDLTVKIKIKESSNLQMEAFKGVESENMPSFIVNGYDMAITLSYLDGE